MIWTRGVVTLVMAALVPGAWAQADEKAEEESPKPTPLVERTGARLVQIDVTLSGPQKTLDSLTRDDFVLKIAHNRIDDFEVDKVCRDPSAGRSLEVPAGEIRAPETEQAAAIPPASLGPTTFLFYFDQPHLTSAGRQESIELAREMIPELIVDGNRATLVSNAARLETLAELTQDQDELLAALKKLEGDLDQWDVYAQREESRIEEILGYLGVDSQGDYQRAQTMAKQYYQEELWRAERDLRRFSMTLGRLANVDQPKAVIYMADNMRSNAGQHYLDLFGQFAMRESASMESDAAASDAGGTALKAQLPFDQLVNEASAYGIRMYPIEPQGMTTATHAAPSTIRFRHSQDTLRDLAAETGGEAFVNGVRAPKIVQKIEEDLACLYLVSFDPAGFPEDQPLQVIVNVDRPKVRVQTRGRIIVQSESTRLTSRLLAAFAAPKSVETSITVRPSVIPTGYTDGKFTALVQVAVPNSEFPASTWDLGASVLSSSTVREASGRLTVSHPDVRVVLQEPMTFAPGPFEIVAVAHNTTADGLGSEQFEGEWPVVNAQAAAVGPIAVLQPGHAALKRGNEIKTEGLIAFTEKEPVLIDRPVALVSVVCKSREVKRELLIERQLVGASSVHFKPMELDLGKDSCVLIRDVVRANTMTPGSFYYRMQVHEGPTELTRAERRFFSWDGEPVAANSPAPDPPGDSP